MKLESHIFLAFKTTSNDFTGLKRILSLRTFGKYPEIAQKAIEEANVTCRNIMAQNSKRK